jgi:hypothetical protein
MTVVVAVRDRAAHPADDGKPDQNLKNRPDQYGGMLVNADHLALVGQKVLIDGGRNRISVRSQPHSSTAP